VFRYGDGDVVLVKDRDREQGDEKTQHTMNNLKIHEPFEYLYTLIIKPECVICNNYEHLELDCMYFFPLASVNQV
jgi:hypothetical protein